MSATDMSTAGRRARKYSLKQKETPPLYFNSQLNPHLLRYRRKHTRAYTQFTSSERASPETKSTKVRFSTSPSERITPNADGSPDVSVASPGRSSYYSASPVKPSILKKSSFSLKLEAVPKRQSASPDREMNSAHLLTLEKILADLAPVRITGLRGVLTKCREKTREFYKEMSRQASMSDEEIREEMAHRSYVRRVLRERRQRVRAMQTAPRRIGRK